MTLAHFKPKVWLGSPFAKFVYTRCAPSVARALIAKQESMMQEDSLPNRWTMCQPSQTKSI